jgi:DNA-binding transcriptional ArsR family regulator
MAQERTTRVLDAAGLRAMAHPLRLRLLSLLRADGPATATGLAARVGESSGTTSYHLRQLAGAGFVEEDTDRGNARERWWRAAQDSTRLEAETWLEDASVRPAVEAYLGAVAAAYAARAQEFLDTQDSWPKRWQAAANLSDFALSLSAAELSRLNDDVERLVESYRRPPRRGDEQVVFQVQAFPRRRGVGR